MRRRLQLQIRLGPNGQDPFGVDGDESPASARGLHHMGQRNQRRLGIEKVEQPPSGRQDDVTAIPPPCREHLHSHLLASYHCPVLTPFSEIASGSSAHAPPTPRRRLKNPFSPRLLKKAQMQGGARCEVRDVLTPYVAAPREHANAADGSFSAACWRGLRSLKATQ